MPSAITLARDCSKGLVMANLDGDNVPPCLPKQSARTIQPRYDSGAAVRSASRDRPSR
jgi:hypothetical protein